MFKFASGKLLALLGVIFALSLTGTQAVAGDAVTFTESSTADTRLPLPLYSWQQDNPTPKAVMLCLHGFPMHGRTFDTYARELTSLGYIVYAPDMRGLGTSYTSGSSTRVEYISHTDDDLAQVAVYVRAKHPGMKVFVTGESMGGSFALRMAALNPKLVDGLIVSGPGLELCRHYLRLIPEGLLSVATLRNSKVDFDSEMQDFFSSDPNVKAEMKKDKLIRRKFTVAELMQTKLVAKTTAGMLDKIPANIPVLVLQSRDDRMCHVDGANLLRRDLKTSDLTLRYFTERGHVLLETQFIKKDTMDSVTTWLEQHSK